MPQFIYKHKLTSIKLRPAAGPPFRIQNIPIFGSKIYGSVKRIYGISGLEFQKEINIGINTRLHTEK